MNSVNNRRSGLAAYSELRVPCEECPLHSLRPYCSWILASFCVNLFLICVFVQYCFASFIKMAACITVFNCPIGYCGKEIFLQFIVGICLRAVK